MVSTNMSWKQNPLQLAEKLILKIAETGELSIDSIDARAVQLGISLNVLDQALALLHKNKQVLAKTKRGTVYYSLKKVEAPKAPGSHLSWVRNNYPPMTPENDGSGIEADYSFMFLSPEEADKYRASLTGRAYIPKKKYKEAKVMTAEQLQLISMFKV